MNKRNKLKHICAQIMKESIFTSEDYRIAEAIYLELEQENIMFINKAHEDNYYWSRCKVISRLLGVDLFNEAA